MVFSYGLRGLTRIEIFFTAENPEKELISDDEASNVFRS